MKKSFVKGARPQTRAYSPAVITEGGKTIWLAGQTGAVDDAGKSLAGDFDAQCRQTFRNIEKTLAEAGAKLSDIVTMTVFLSDARHSRRPMPLAKGVVRILAGHTIRRREAFTRPNDMFTLRPHGYLCRSRHPVRWRQVLDEQEGLRSIDHEVGAEGRNVRESASRRVVEGGLG